MNGAFFEICDKLLELTQPNMRDLAINYLQTQS